MACLFCKIANDEIPCERVYKDESIVAFKDINPQAPIHILIIPKEHIATVNNLKAHEFPLLGKMTQTATQLAHELNVANDGYRLVLNCNAHGGQQVFHIHLHLLAGRQLTWPPG